MQIYSNETIRYTKTERKSWNTISTPIFFQAILVEIRFNFRFMESRLSILFLPVRLFENNQFLNFTKKMAFKLFASCLCVCYHDQVNIPH